MMLTVDDSDTAFGIRGGYMFTDIVGVEVGYVDLGAFEADGDRPGNRMTVTTMRMQLQQD